MNRLEQLRSAISELDAGRGNVVALGCAWWSDLARLRRIAAEFDSSVYRVALAALYDAGAMREALAILLAAEERVEALRAGGAITTDEDAAARTSVTIALCAPALSGLFRFEEADK